MKKQQPPIEAVLYARVSPKGRRGSRSGEELAAESLRSQLEMLHQYCSARKYKIVGQYSDEFISGDEENRAGLWDAVDQCTADRVLIIWRYDRLARSVFLEESIKRELQRKGARIEAVDGNNGNSPEDELVRGILAYVAEYERKLISARTKAQIRAKQKAGLKITEHEPFGTMSDPLDDRKLVPHPVEVQLLYHMLELRMTGMSYRAVGTQMNRRGERWRGKKFHHNLVKRSLVRWLNGLIPVPPPPNVTLKQVLEADLIETPPDDQADDPADLLSGFPDR